MILEFVDILGLIKNDTGVLGKAFIFNVMCTEKTFDCILFVHPSEPAFITTHIDDSDIDKQEILKLVFEKYTLEQLLEA